MTIDQFNNTAFRCGDQAKYDSNIYPVQEINFNEMLFGLKDNDGDVFWVRCENVELIPFG